MSKKPTARDSLFDFFNEVGIINQLASALFSKHLPEGVHVSHFAIINHMVRLGDVRTPHQLARAMQVSKATMSHSLGILQARNFVSVESHPEDGRSKTVRLTEAGRTFRGEAIRKLQTALQPIAASIDPVEITAALPTLRMVRAVLDAERN